MINGIGSFGNVTELEERKGEKFMKKVVDTVATWEEAKNRVLPRLVNYKWNNGENNDTLLRRKFGDLAIQVYIPMDDETRVVINKTTVEVVWKKTIDEVIETAIENTRKNTGDPITDFLGMPILTNREKVYGASMLLDWRTRAIIGEKYEEGAWLIPSSIHEWIILPKNKNREEKVQIEELTEMIKEVNEKQVEEADWLSDHVYEITNEGEVISHENK